MENKYELVHCLIELYASFPLPLCFEVYGYLLS